MKYLYYLKLFSFLTVIVTCRPTINDLNEQVEGEKKYDLSRNMMLRSLKNFLLQPTVFQIGSNSDHECVSVLNSSEVIEVHSGTSSCSKHDFLRKINEITQHKSYSKGTFDLILFLPITDKYNLDKTMSDIIKKSKNVIIVGEISSNKVNSNKLRSQILEIKEKEIVNVSLSPLQKNTKEEQWEYIYHIFQ